MGLDVRFPIRTRTENKNPSVSGTDHLIVLKNYSASKREGVAVVCALKFLLHYLMYEIFVVRIDHAVMHCLLAMTEPSGRLIRWRLRLAQFEFEEKY